LEIRKIIYPTSLNSLKDPENDNVDIIVELEDGFSYTMVVATPKNLYTLMENEDQFFLSSGPPMLFVKKLTEDNIYKVVQEFATNNAYWLKSYYLAADHDIKHLNQLLARFKEQVKEVRDAE
jgi:hypothetical protein